MKTLKEKSKVIQAFFGGKDVEVLQRGEWRVISGVPVWRWDRFDYRIKPEPMEFHINIVKGSTLGENTRKQINLRGEMECLKAESKKRWKRFSIRLNYVLNAE